MDRNFELYRRTEKLQGSYPSALTLIDRDSWAANGLTNEHLLSVGQQVSAMIDEYNASHPNEMLPKSPDTIIEQIQNNRSIVVAHRQNGHIEVMCHGTIYPALENGEDKVLAMQVVEIGSLIVHPDYRAHGMGSLGNLMLLQLADQFPDVVPLATIKQTTTAWAFENAGTLPISFWDHPYLSYLTCTCSHCSEAEGHVSCQFRRPQSESNIIALDKVLDRSGGSHKIDCTLVVADKSKAQAFETKCRQLHEANSGFSLQPGIITKDSMKQARSFFDSLKTI